MDVELQKGVDLRVLSKQIMHASDIGARHCDLLKGVGSKFCFQQGCTDVAGCFCCGTEVRRTEGPAHLQRTGDYYHDWVTLILAWEHIAEIVLFTFGDHHSPKSIFDVQFQEAPRAVLFVTGGNGMDEPWKHLSQLGHGI